MAFTKDETETVKAATALIKRELAAGEEVVLHKFGSFKAKEVAAHKGTKPGTKEVIDIAARTAVRFKGFKSFTSSL